MDHKLSICDLSFHETSRIVDTPLSLEACKINGIDPRELLYDPPEYYNYRTNNDEIRMLTYGFYNKRRHQKTE